MLRRVREFWGDQAGASVVFALLLLLVAGMVSAVIVSAATSSLKAVDTDKDHQQATLNVQSAAAVLKDALVNTEITYTYTEVVTEVAGEGAQTETYATYSVAAVDASGNSLANTLSTMIDTQKTYAGKTTTLTLSLSGLSGEGAATGAAAGSAATATAYAPTVAAAGSAATTTAYAPTVAANFLLSAGLGSTSPQKLAAADFIVYAALTYMSGGVDYNVYLTATPAVSVTITTEISAGSEAGGEGTGTDNGTDGVSGEDPSPTVTVTTTTTTSRLTWDAAAVIVSTQPNQAGGAL